MNPRRSASSGSRSTWHGRSPPGAGRTHTFAEVVERQCEVDPGDLLAVAQHGCDGGEGSLGGEVGRQVLGVQGHTHQPGLGEGVVGHDHVDAVGQQHADVARRGQAEAEEVVGQAISGLVEPGERHRLVAADEGDALGMVVSGPSDEASELHHPPKRRTLRSPPATSSGLGTSSRRRFQGRWRRRGPGNPWRTAEPITDIRHGGPSDQLRVRHQPRPELSRVDAWQRRRDHARHRVATVGDTVLPPLERGWRRSFTETWDVMEWPSCPTTFAPIVGGRFYINISAFRRLADLTPGTSPEDIDRTLFAAGGITLDPYEVPDEDGYAERGERIAAATAAFLAEPPVDRVAAEHAAAQERRREGRANRQTRSSAELLARMRALIEFNESDFVTLFIGSSVSPVVLGSLQAGLAKVYGDEGYDLGRQAVSGLGGIESADAGRAVAGLAGLDGEECDTAFEDVLRRYGFRGVNEWEIASPSWEIRPDALRRAVAAVRAGGAERDPDAVRAAVLERFAADDTRDQFPELDMWLERCKVWMGIRERTKATCVLTINEQRLDALEIGTRLVADGKLESPEQIYFLTLDELRCRGAGDRRPRSVHARASAQQQLEQYQEPLHRHRRSDPACRGVAQGQPRPIRRPTTPRSPAPPGAQARRRGAPG